jgi:hypothetical protein
MSTSDRVVAAESAGCSLLVVGATALAAPHDVLLTTFPLHPVWLPILLMSARYGTRGLFIALAIGWGGLVAADLALGGSVADLTVHTENAVDLMVLGVTIVIAWIAMSHESRIADADRRLAEATEQLNHADENVRALHASLGYLRTRHDRVDISIGLWRSLARRLEQGDPREAARAVLELCEIRAGARAGVVRIRDANHLVTLAHRGQWTTDPRRNHDFSVDATVRAAIRTRLVTPAQPGASELDADVAIPVLHEGTGAVIGVIALRGVAPGRMRAADLRDVGVIAQWLAPALAQEMHIQPREAMQVSS